VRGVLGHIGRCTSVLTAQSQSLQHAQGNQDHRCRDANGGVAWQKANNESGKTHDHDGDQKGVFATDHVAQPPEHERTEGPDNETSRKSQQGKNKCRTGVQSAEKLLCNNRSQ